MDDSLVSRQAAIDAVNNAFDRETLLTGFVRSIAVRAIRDMPSAQPEQRWIPCGERLPEDDVEVLITDDSGGVQWLAIDKMLSYEDGSGRFWVASQNSTAWMPLPKPYEPKEDK